MARWVTIRKDAFPIDYRMPKASAWLQFNWDASDPNEKGERYLPDGQADFMIARGHGKEGKADAKSTTKSRKGKTSRPKRAKTAANAKPADTGPNASLVDAPLVAAGSPGDRDRLDPTAG